MQIVSMSVRPTSIIDESTRALQAITAEMSDYSNRLIDDSTATMTDVARAQSMPEAFARLAAYNKRTAQDYMQQSAKLMNMYSAIIQQHTRCTQALMAGSTKV